MPKGKIVFQRQSLLCIPFGSDSFAFSFPLSWDREERDRNLEAVVRLLLTYFCKERRGYSFWLSAGLGHSEMHEIVSQRFGLTYKFVADL